MRRCSLNTVGNTYWLSNRQTNRSAAAQAIPALSVREFSRDLLPTALQGLRLIPSWILLAMILIATLGICSSVILRSKEELRVSTLEYGRIGAEISSIRRSNSTLQVQISRIASDPAAIESAARERLGMVKPSDIIVPIESSPVSNFGALSFVR
ncbi:MAG: Septum formation initiator [Blastocatellia bacterium]|jgi:cell division protein FtsB|nr:Septum formation initiator [Blastocatellia bacterium]